MAILPAINYERRNLKRGELHARAKLTDRDVELLRRFVESGELNQRQAAVKFEISEAQVSRLINYRQR